MGQLLGLTCRHCQKKETLTRQSIAMNLHQILGTYFALTFALNEFIPLIQHYSFIFAGNNHPEQVCCGKVFPSPREYSNFCVHYCRTYSFIIEFEALIYLF